MTDQLAEIKAREFGPTQADADWLIAEVERLRMVVESAALSMQTLGQPVIRDNLLGAIGDLKSRLTSAGDP